MSLLVNVADVIALYESRGHRRYGESLSQLEHALQCATLARTDGARDELVVAALLHDIGHLASDSQRDDEQALLTYDAVHEALGARMLTPIFGSEVAQPVALHVTAKRWRCTRDPAYFARMSRASQSSFETQGGMLSDEDCQRFEDHPGFREALWLRAWDDAAKVTGLDAGTLGDWSDLLGAMALGS